MDSTRQSFWQLITLSAILPVVGFWPALFSQSQQPVLAQEEGAVEAKTDVATHYFPLPQVEEYNVKRTMRLTVTAYSSSPDETDADPFTTASGARVRPGVIAHNGLPFGTRVRFPDAFGEKIFVVQDRLHPRKGYYIADLWMPSKQEAERWGAQILTMQVLGN